ncbi:uncharacterized protein BT62DRAFT_1009682 [Guyanagaster necrorhizus]|uniref:Uncharacterized protein n=1 Tax=Guyanagaster necrorhizus TaxID=856835 RepID=A0A9P7VMC2_9AGAR|nr:uncharacterized protein BT62DRAFT_1009682 [Guyanagaster necrorhizus MCA 3950]KAG7443082.1 hypothetical protein BT62DRAFT_1009682 [Guyanagaster necrorhizus MCA 3950]
MGPKEIHITTSHDSQKHAARVLSEILTELTIRRAYIGGYDIDILIEIPKDTLDLSTLREKVTELDKRFTENILKFYFVEDLDAFSEDPESQNPEETVKSSPKKFTGIELLSRSKSIVLIETLSAGTLGLPDSVDLVYNVPSLPILHPIILILTKLQRWCQIYKSLRPKTLKKALTDSFDIDYLIEWLSQHGMLIAFDDYKAKNIPKERLVRHVRMYWEHKDAREEKEVMAQLEEVLNETDKAIFLASASPKASDNTDIG